MAAVLVILLWSSRWYEIPITFTLCADTPKVHYTFGKVIDTALCTSLILRLFVRWVTNEVERCHSLVLWVSTKNNLGDPLFQDFLT